MCTRKNGRNIAFTFLLSFKSQRVCILLALLWRNLLAFVIQDGPLQGWNEHWILYLLSIATHTHICYLPISVGKALLRISQNRNQGVSQAGSLIEAQLEKNPLPSSLRLLAESISLWLSGGPYFLLVVIWKPPSVPRGFTQLLAATLSLFRLPKVVCYVDFPKMATSSIQ